MVVTKSEMEILLERLEWLEDREQIRAVLSRYSRGADRGDPSVIHDIMWPDATLCIAGVDDKPAGEIIDFVYGSMLNEQIAATHHFMGNMIIEVDGRFARSETYAYAHHLTHASAESIVGIIGSAQPNSSKFDAPYELLLGFRYLDLLEKRSGVWKILKRELIFDWNRVGPYTGIESGGLYNLTPLRGARGAEDPSSRRA